MLQSFELYLHFFAQFEVERTEWLVEEQHLGAIDQCPSQRDTLLLPARELLGATLTIAGQLHQREGFGNALGDVAFVDFLHLQAECDVLVDGHMREQRIGLKNGVHVALMCGDALDVDTAERDNALSGVFEAGNHA